MDYMEIRDGTQPGVSTQTEPRARLKVNSDGSINQKTAGQTLDALGNTPVSADQLRMLIEVQLAMLTELRAIRALLATQVGALELIPESPIGASPQ